MQNTQDKKPEGHKKKKNVLLIFPPFFLIPHVSQNVAEEKLGSPAIVHKRAPITVKPAGQN